MSTKGGGSILGKTTFSRPVVFSCRDFFSVRGIFQVAEVYSSAQFIEDFTDFLAALYIGVITRSYAGEPGTRQYRGHEGRKMTRLRIFSPINFQSKKAWFLSVLVSQITTK